MQPWVVESGTLWALNTGIGKLPPLFPAQVDVVFGELGEGDVAELASAMNLQDTKPIEQRFQDGRRCFCLRAKGQIVTYGWVTHGIERVGELERKFYLNDNEAYIWDCGTIHSWRGNHCYSMLLSHIIYQLHGEGVSLVWIGASRQNKPSIQGFVNAGFQPVVDCTYGRINRLTLMWVKEDPIAPQALVHTAYRILINQHEHRLGRLLLGYKKMTPSNS